MDSGTTKLSAILLIAVMLAGVSIALVVLTQPEPQNQEENYDLYFVTVVGANETAINVTMTEMFSMITVSKNSSYQNTYGNVRGEGIYTGVKVSDLIDLVGGMEEKDTIRVIAGDDYTQIFEYAKVYPNQTYLDIQGDMVLAYEYNGTKVPEYEDGFRLTFLPDDGYYSNADANATTDPDPAAAGPQWVSNVTRIEVLPYTYSATIDLSESELRTLPATSGEGAYIKKDGVTIIGPYNFTGVKVSYILDQIDYLPENYIVTARSADGYSVTYSKDKVYGEMSGYNSTGYPVGIINSTMVIAYEQDNGSIIEDGPLWLVFLNEDGNLTDGNQWVKGVVSLTILEISPQTAASYNNDNDFALYLSYTMEDVLVTKFE